MLYTHANNLDREHITMSKKVLTLWSGDVVNEEEVSILRSRSKEVPVPFSNDRKKDIKTLIDAFLTRDDAVGLAAPQIGIRRRIIIFRNKGFDEKKWSRSEEDYDVLINPRITQSRGDMVTMSEGCLSCPEIQVEISRSHEIKVRAYDVNGRKMSKRYTDYLARVVQHEMDHLNGKLIIDHEGTLYIPQQSQESFVDVIRKMRIPGEG
jgi:peptide deformylase